VDPLQVMGEVEEGAGALEKASASMYRATLAFEQAEARLERELQKEIVRIYNDSKRAGERPPAEDLRRALALDALERREPGLYQNFLATKARLAARTSRYRGLAASVSARQSLLRSFQGAGG
jgi:hypothetical protein